MLNIMWYVEKVYFLEYIPRVDSPGLNDFIVTKYLMERELQSLAMSFSPFSSIQYLLTI